MPKYLITTCPHCKKEFRGEYISPPCVVPYKIDIKYKYHPDGVYTRRPAYAPHKPKYKQCPLCQEPIDMNSWQEHRVAFGEEKDASTISWRRFKKCFWKFLP